MKVFAVLRSPLLSGVLAATVVLPAISGCGGGFGELKPTLAAQQAGSQTVAAGKTATFTVTATGTGPFAYQWYLNGEAIAGATASSYTTAATNSSQNGSVYTVTVTNAAGTVTAGPFVLTVQSPPTISSQPASQTVSVGQTATFAVTATGTAPLSYQWYDGTVAISGATAGSYTTPPATAPGTSTYTVAVTDAGGTTTSTAATLTVSALATPTLTFAPVPTETYGNAPFTVSASSASPGAVTYTVVSGPATISGSTVTLTGAGTVVIQASQAASGDFAATSANTTISVAPETPALTFAPIPTKTFGSAPFTVSAASASPGAVTYSVVSGPATISGSTVTLTGVGTVVLGASQAATGNYAAVSGNTTFTVGVGTPTLTFAPIPTMFVGNPPFTVSASSASAGAVTYSVISGPATISGSTVTLTGAGTVVLGASQAASGNYTAASGQTTFTVGPYVSISTISPAGMTAGPTTEHFTATASTGGVTWSASGGTIDQNGVWTAPDVAGTYTITATSATNPAVSVSTTFTVTKPVVTMQPISRNVCTGSNPTFLVAASYATGFQWHFGASVVGNAAQLSLSNVTSANSGAYSCSVSNGAGATNSNTVQLNVVTPTTLIITNQPASVSVYATQTATFSISASGTGTLNYQWYTGTAGSGVAIPGATSGVYTTGALTTANSGTSYYVTVTDPDCTATTLTSSAATLTVSGTDTAVPPTIVVQPTAQTATVGGTATYSVTASGTDTLTYQWYRVAYTSTQLSTPTAGVAIVGATSSTYTVPAGQTEQSNDGDEYFVVVTNDNGEAVSNRVGLAVGTGIQINAQPNTEFVAVNALASFSVGAICTGCTPAYQWYWYAPGAQAATALTDGAVTSGNLVGATLSGSTSSSLSLQNVPATASGGTFYALVTSTSDGTTASSGTNPVPSATAALFAGSLGTVGNTAAGQGLCNSPVTGTNWALNGGNPGTLAGDIPFQDTSACTVELSTNEPYDFSAVYWPVLISTAKFSVAFTVTVSSIGTPADGFTMVLADPSQGASTASVGASGGGLGADGIPGLVLGFDTYQNGNLQDDPNCTYPGPSGSGLCDPVPVPYIAVGPGATALWESPWYLVNGKLNTQQSTDYTPSAFANATHAYVVTVDHNILTVTLDGYEVLTGGISLPPAAYLGFTASTGGSAEQVTISNLTATIGEP